MSAALVIMILAVLGLAIASIVITLYVIRAIIVALSRFIRHEMLMRPQNIYFRM